MDISFSILRYRLITDEFMNIGILFHNRNTDERKLETITKWKRLKSFDDELDIKMFKIIIEGIKEEINNNLFTKNINFDIYDYPKKYVNELTFSDVYKAEVDHFGEYVDITKKNILRYDYEKKDRPNKDEQVKQMKTIMKSSSIDFSVKAVSGEYNENVNYDYIIGEYAYKIFSFENKKLCNLVHSAKAWAYTAAEMEGKYKTIFIYDVDLEDERFSIIISILKKAAYKVIKYDEGIHFVLENYKKSDKKFLGESDI